MTENFAKLKEERTQLLQEANVRQLTNEERERLKALSSLLDDSIPTDATLDDMARRIEATKQDAVGTKPPPARKGPPRTVSGTLAMFSSDRLDAILNQLEELGFGLRNRRAGTTGSKGEALFAAAADLRSIYDGLEAAKRQGLRSALLDEEQKLQLYARMGDLEREYGAFLAELRSGK